MNLNLGLAGVALAASLFAAQAHAAAYNFSVTYSGSGNASLDAGSDDPIGASLLDGDSFTWNLHTGTADSYWNVVNTVGAFPLMAFGVQENGLRDGDYTLDLLNDGISVYTLTESSRQAYVHMGTNTVTLGAGLQFDEMVLSYTLVKATEQDDPFPPVSSTINGLLPIFGAPEMTAPGDIAYVAAIPEPETYALMLAGLGVVGWMARRRQR